jgi:hypothetical protein
MPAIPSPSRVTVPTIVIAVAAIAAIYGWAVLASTPAHPGSIGLNLNALGTDFMVFYSGARWFWTGHLAELLDGDRFTIYLNGTFAHWLSQPLSFRPWVYPPNYLLLMLPFGLLPFAAAYVLFQLTTAASLAAALCIGGKRQTLPLVIAAALLSPAAAINAGMGQNGFLSAALIVAGLRFIPTRPVLAGAILGLLTIKPQFWLLVPIVLIAAREWRALVWSAISAAAVALISAGVFGFDTWRHWIDLARGSYGDPNGEWVELGRMWGDSIYACLVSGGAPQSIANALQAAGTLAGIALAYFAFRRDLPWDRKIAILLAATILAAPHTSLADTVLLTTAAALWAGELATAKAPLAQWTLALALWIAALVNPPLVSPIGRFTPLLVIGFIGVALSIRPAVAMALTSPSVGVEPVRLP